LSRENNLCIAFDSSTCFKLPNGAERSPDASWVRREKWNSLSDEQKRKFPPLCPDFVLELRSETDALKPLPEKMQEYMENGASLGLLIDPKTKQVEIYRAGKEVEILNNPEQLSKEDILPGFILKLKPIFSSN
jgi:Uma2 family endonuclease